MKARAQPYSRSIYLGTTCIGDNDSPQTAKNNMLLKPFKTFHSNLVQEKKLNCT